MESKNNISGMLLLDKPSKITSFQAVHQIRKILNVKKVGHCGTLDPAATGLLLIMIGKATKLQDKFMKQDKVYRSSFLLGTVTDTGDTDGNIIEQKDSSHIEIEKLKEVILKFQGEITQIPPMFSALKYKGKKLYELARKGIEVERKPRKVNIRSIEILSFKNPVADIRIECSSGTYIRTLAEDIGKELGCGATVCALRREKIGDFDVEDALKEKDFKDFDTICKNIIDYQDLISGIENE